MTPRERQPLTLDYGTSEPMPVANEGFLLRLVVSIAALTLVCAIALALLVALVHPFLMKP